MLPSIFGTKKDDEGAHSGDDKNPD